MQTPTTFTAELIGKAVAVALFLGAVALGLWYWRWSGEENTQQRANQAVETAAAKGAEDVSAAKDSGRAVADAEVSNRLTQETKRRETAEAEVRRLLASQAGKGMAERHVPEETEAWIRARAGERRSSTPKGSP